MHTRTTARCGFAVFGSGFAVGALLGALLVLGALRWNGALRSVLPWLRFALLGMLGKARAHGRGGRFCRLLCEGGNGGLWLCGLGRGAARGARRALALGWLWVQPKALEILNFGLLPAGGLRAQRKDGHDLEGVPVRRLCYACTRRPRPAARLWSAGSSPSWMLPSWAGQGGSLAVSYTDSMDGPEVAVMSLLELRWIGPLIACADGGRGTRRTMGESGPPKIER